MKNTPLALSWTIVVVLAFASAPVAWAHCDTLDGPVIVDARAAIASGQPEVVLKWVRADDEPEVRSAFAQTLAVRKLSPDAAALADRWFFENLVRIHRAGEGAPYTGLKPGTGTLAGVELADRALASGDAAALLDQSADQVVRELRKRFDRVRESMQHKDHSVAAGRAYVAAYVDFIHYAESVLGNETEPASDAAAHGH